MTVSLQLRESGAPLSPAVAKLVLEEVRKSDPEERFDLSGREIN